MSIFSKSMRVILFVTAFSLLLANSAKAQNEVAIGSATTKSNAILWLNGNGSQGLILPTVSNKTSVSNPDKGMIVYDNSDNKVWYRNDNAWVEVGGAAGGGGDNSTLNLQLQGNQLQLRDGTTVLNSINIAAGTQANGSFLVFQGGSWQFGQLTDATGTGTAFQVTGLRGKSLATLPATSQALVYDPAANSGNGGWVFQSVTLPTLANGQILTGNGTTNSATTLIGDATLSGGTITISNNAITTAKINANAVDATKLADNSVTSLKIADGTITGSDIANTTITANKLAQSAALNGQVLKWNGTNWVPAFEDVVTGGTPTLSNGQILIGDGTTNSAGALTGDATLSGSTLTISNNAITTAKINANAVDATKLADNAVTTLKVADNSITTAKINANAVDATKLADNAVTTLKVADNAITSAKIVDATITGTDIANSTITGAKIANTTITGANVANTSLTADKLAQSAAASGQVLKWNGTNWAPADDDAGVGATPTLANGQILIGNGTTNSAAALTGDATISGGTITISNNAITTAKINANAVDATKLADNAVTTLKVADNTITSAKIVDATISGTDIANTTITGANIAATTITADKLAQSTATPGQVLKWNGTNWVPQNDNTGAAAPTLSNGQILIGDGTTNSASALTGDATLSGGAITIANNAVTSTKIADGTIAAADLAAGSVSGGTGGVITDATITNADIAAAAAIAGTKITPAFGAQTISTTGALSAGATTVSGLTIGTSVWPANAAGALTNNGTGTLTWAPSFTNPMTTAGDIIYGGIGGTATRLATGTGFLKGGATPTYSAVNLASGDVSGVLPIAQGGTGLSAFGGGLLYASSPTTIGDIGNGTSGQMLLMTGTSPSWQTMSGDATIGGTGVITVANNAITDVKVATGISGSKIIPNFGIQNISTTGTLSAGATTVSGLTIGTSVWPANAAGVLTNNGTGTLSWAPSSGWNLTGNAGTNPATNFIGTTDAQDLVFKTNGAERMRIFQAVNLTTMDGTNVGSSVLRVNNLAGSGSSSGVYGSTSSPSGAGVQGVSSAGGVGVAGSSDSNFGVFGTSTSGIGVYGQTSGSSAAIWGNNPGAGNGVYGQATAAGARGVYGANNIAGGVGVYGESVNGEAGRFSGKLVVEGAIGLGATPDYGTAGSVLTSAGPGATPTWGNGSGWSLTGNTGTVDGTNFIGTTDNVPLNFRVFNQRAGRIEVSTSTANTFYGYRGGNINTGNFNTAVGYEAMLNNTTGRDNAAVGYRAMLNNTTGFENAALGRLALELNTTGIANTAIGSRALNKNTASENTAVGTEALFNNTTAGANTAVGVLSLAANTAGFNSALGAFSMQSNTTGTQNAALGYRALISNTTGSLNTAIGNSAGVTFTPANANTTGSQNTFVGYNSGPGTTTQLTNATAIGANAVVNQSNSLVLGSINGVNGATASTNVGIGTSAPAARLDIAGTIKITDGTQAAGRVLTSDANGLASWTTPSGSVLINNPGTRNLFAGSPIGTATTGTDNAFIGSGAGDANTSGSWNVFVGTSAATNHSTGDLNTIMGWNAGQLGTAHQANTFIGAQSGQNSTGGVNTFVGEKAGQANTTGSQSVFIGNSAGLANTTGGQNTILGYFANVGAAGLQNATAIGYRASVNQNNSLVLGSIAGVNSAASSTNVGIGTTTPTARLDVSGNTLFRGTNTNAAPTVSSGLELMVGRSNFGTLIAGQTSADIALNWGGASGGFRHFIQSRHNSVANSNSNSIDFYVNNSTTAAGSIAPNNTTPNGNVLAMSMTATGIGIGTATPNANTKLHISGAGTQYLRVEGTGTLASGGIELDGTGTVDWRIVPELGILTFKLGDVNGTMNNMYFMNSGNFSPVNATNPAPTLGQSTNRWGTIFTTVAVNVSSDRRLKNNIHNLNYGLKEILELRPVSYSLRSDKTKSTYLGLIAQEVQELIPEIVSTGDDTEKTLGMRYAELVPVLIKAIQEQQEIINKLKNASVDSAAQTQQEIGELKKELAEIKRILGVEAKATKND